MNIEYFKMKLPTLNMQQLWLLLADAYYRIDTSQDENYILVQREIVALLEEEVVKRKEVITRLKNTVLSRGEHLKS